VTHPFEELVSFSPAKKSILLITENSYGTSKYVFNTDQALAIASLIKDYVDIHLHL
jgi:hypothetical protein